MDSDLQTRTAHEYFPKALISDCELVCEEFSAQYVEKIRNTIFEAHQDRVGPQHVQQWFKTVTHGPNAVRSLSTNEKMNSRLISWKTGKKFLPENLFFRTVDTSRLLPMALADFRIQWYAHRASWAWLDGHDKKNGIEPRRNFQLLTLSGLMFPLLVMRNMHDYGGADIPIVLTSWNAKQLAHAFDYWVDISKPGMSECERREKFTALDSTWGVPQPCFMQVDLLVRSLLSDPATEYVPRFIVFMSIAKDAKGCALFTDPSFQPPKELIDSYPPGCGGTDCVDENCGFFDFAACRSLAKGSDLVRKDKFPRNTVRCNVWTCQVEERGGYTGPSKFQTCQRCGEVLYCCKAHQEHDWKSHKRVCEARAA
ncbi:hypothetical protein BDN70DRAFT_810997 [Pholiota conissans]|uniref:MYND-type domain-containing protein n=1 Tax=Pholiota conissans TaxID=109636 RepID=A0A9P5Z073_9AGAR|nr:hypothetical protein BDN70DRAFT_810997 [Pholiota conissans]